VSRQPIPTGDRVHAILMLVVAAGTLAYWLAYFFAGAVQTADDAVYTGFENAFPLGRALLVGMPACGPGEEVVEHFGVDDRQGIHPASVRIRRLLVRRQPFECVQRDVE